MRFAEEFAKVWQKQPKSNSAQEQTDRGRREGLANHERAREALKRQLAEANSARESDAAGLRGHQEKFAQELAKVHEEYAQSNKAHAEDMEAFRKQQRESQALFVHDVAHLKQQLAQMSAAQSSSDKKLADLNGQVAPCVTRLEQEAGNLKQRFM
jgi:hypothetical protein